MSLDLGTRQRAMLAEMGIRLFDAPASARHADGYAEPLGQANAEPPQRGLR